MPLDHVPGFVVERNTYRLLHARLKQQQQDIEVEVGDIDADDFRPVLAVKRWGNEASFALELPDPGQGRRRDGAVGSTVFWRRGDVEARFYDLPDEPGEFGGFEFEVVLHAAPASNVIPLNIRRSAGVQFLFQPPKAQQVADHLARTGEDLTDVIHVPDRAAYSYAVYSNRKHNKYQTGKIAHLFRPHATDAAGNSTWCEFADDAEATGTLRIIIPQQWLADAVYPVVVDPTVGHSSQGSTYYRLGDSTDQVNTMVATSSGGSDDSTGALSGDQSLDALKVWCQRLGGGGDPTIQMAVYVAPGDTPSSSHTLLSGSPSNTNNVTDTAAHTETLSGFSATMLDGVSYVVAVMQTGPKWKLDIFYDTGSWKDRHWNTTETFGSWPSDLSGTWTGGGARMSMWGEYSAASSSSAKVVAVEADATYTTVFGKIVAVEADATYTTVFGKVVAVEADLTYTAWAGKVVAIEADATYTTVFGKVVAVEADATYSTVFGKIVAVEADVTYTPWAGRVVAVELDATYTPVFAKVVAVEADATYTTVFAKVVAVEADLTYTVSESAKVVAVEADLTYTPWAGKVVAVEADTTYTTVFGKVVALEADATYTTVFAKVVAVEADLTYTTEEQAKVVAVEADLTYTPVSGKVVAVELDATYTPVFAKVVAVEADATYTPWAGRVVAVEADATYTTVFAKVVAVELDATYTTVFAKVVAVEADATYTPWAGRVVAVEADATYTTVFAKVVAVELDATYTEVFAKIVAVEADLTYAIPGARVVAVEAELTYTLDITLDETPVLLRGRERGLVWSQGRRIKRELG